jgi:hypothetical protein
VDERVQADDRVEGPVRKRDLRRVGAHERGPRDEPASPVDLNVAEVDAGDAVAAVGERPGDRDTAAAPEIQHAGRRGQPSLEVRQPGNVLRRIVVVTTVEVGDGVVGAPDGLDGIGPVHEPILAEHAAGGEPITSGRRAERHRAAHQQVTYRQEVAHPG